MTKAELLEKVHSSAPEGTTKKLCESLVESLFETMAAAIKKDSKFAYPGFGTFTVRKRKARKGRNPQTGETIKIKASKTVGFKAAAALKARL